VRDCRPDSAANSLPTRFWHHQPSLLADIQDLAQALDFDGFLPAEQGVLERPNGFSP
jgi:hypothetical protein